MKFGPDDEDAFYRTRDDLVAAFEATIQQEYGWVASQVLDFKWGYLDGDLAGWSTEDVDEILLGLYPAKVTVDPEDIDAAGLNQRSLSRFRSGRTSDIFCSTRAAGLPRVAAAESVPSGSTVAKMLP